MSIAPGTVQITLIMSKKIESSSLTYLSTCPNIPKFTFKTSSALGGGPEATIAGAVPAPVADEAAGVPVVDEDDGASSDFVDPAAAASVISTPVLCASTRQDVLWYLLLLIAVHGVLQEVVRVELRLCRSMKVEVVVVVVVVVGLQAS